MTKVGKITFLVKYFWPNSNFIFIRDNTIELKANFRICFAEALKYLTETLLQE